MNKKIIWFVVNPISGGISKKTVIKAIDEEMSPDRYAWRICQTAYPGHGAVLATTAAENKVDVVVAIGGDGTINEVARSLLHTETALGIVPCGSGNGLARHLQIPLEFRRALRLINDGRCVKVDYGLINKRPFFCTCGMGFDAEVSDKFSSSKQRGIQSYIEKTLLELAKYKPETYKIIDKHGEREHKAFCIAFANASQYGNNAYIAPEASMKDGLMDVTIVKPFPLIESAFMALMLFSGNFKKGMKHVETMRTDKLRIIRQKTGVAHCDGDPIVTDKIIDIEIVPAGLKVITNSDASAHPVSLIQTIGQQVMPKVSTPTEMFRQMSRTIANFWKIVNNN